MSRNPNQGSNIGCVIIIIIGALIYNGFDALFLKPKREAEEAQIAKEEAQKLINFWSKPTVDFFKTFNCSNLKFEEKEFKINKFLAVDSYINNECQIDENTDSNYTNYKIFDSLYTKKINEANAIIWIVQKRGKEEGIYTGGEKAIRLSSEINFIDKTTNTIFKRIDVDYLGVAPEQITRRNNNHMDEEFGERDNKGEYIAIINEIKRQRGFPPLR